VVVSSFAGLPLWDVHLTVLFGSPGQVGTLLSSRIDHSFAFEDQRKIMSRKKDVESRSALRLQHRQVRGQAGGVRAPSRLDAPF
jgi:hypothetical protein